MKKFFLLAASAALLASCSYNGMVEDINTEDETIGFSTFVDKATKAELTNEWFTSDGNSFGVFGFKGDLTIFGNASASGDASGDAAEQVTYASADADWTHPTVRFWDKAANNYEFYAYAPFEQAVSFVDKKFSFANIVANPIANIASADADLAIANPITGFSYAQRCQTHSNVSEGYVEFTFNHLLSKLSFLVATTLKIDENGSGDAKALNLKSVKLNFPQATSTSWAQTAASGCAGTTTFTDYVAVASSDADFETEVFVAEASSDYFAVTALKPDEEGEDFGGETFIVAPVNTTNTEHVFQVEVVYEITYNDGVVEECTNYATIGGNVPEGNVYKPAQNSNYEITLIIGPTKIEFCVLKINDWDEAIKKDINVE